MRVIGVDPGSRTCGYGILESHNGKLKHIASGAITPPATHTLSKRLHHIYSSLNEVIQQFSPDLMSIEEMFFAKNANSAIKLGQARGVALLAAENSGIQIYEYSPTKVKLAVTGSGRAKKFEIMKMVSYILKIEEFEKSDISDALAIALCHINISKIPELKGQDLSPRSGRKRRRFTLNDIATKG